MSDLTHPVDVSDSGIRSGIWWITAFDPMIAGVGHRVKVWAEHHLDYEPVLYVFMRRENGSDYFGANLMFRNATDGMLFTLEFAQDLTTYEEDDDEG